MTAIPIKTRQEIAIMQEAGAILAQIMERLKNKTAVGVSLLELEKAAKSLVSDFKVEPAFLNYLDKKEKNGQPYPAVLCCSVNEVVVHGLPTDYVLKEGDILGLDLGIKYKGFYSDMAITMPIGSVDGETARLLRVAKKALKFGIAKCHLGNTFGDVGNTIQRFVESQGFAVIREMCGHGIGKQLHEEPSIPNVSKRHKGETIKEGMTFCLEPMISMGDWRLTKADDGFGYKTKDNSLTAHFERAIAIVHGKPNVLTIL